MLLPVSGVVLITQTWESSCEIKIATKSMAEIRPVVWDMCAIQAKPGVRIGRRGGGVRVEKALCSGKRAIGDLIWLPLWILETPPPPTLFTQRGLLRTIPEFLQLWPLWRDALALDFAWGAAAGFLSRMCAHFKFLSPFVKITPKKEGGKEGAPHLGVCRIQMRITQHAPFCLGIP